MSSRSQEQSVKVLLQDARLALDEVSRVSKDAQKSLINTKHQINNRKPSTERLGVFLFEAVKQQHTLLNEIIESFKFNIRANIIDEFNHKYDSEMLPALKGLNQIISQLEDILVPSILIQSSIKESDNKGIGDQKLSSFISLDEIVFLKKNINIYKENRDKLHGLLDEQLNTLLLTPYANLKKRFTGLSKQFVVLSSDLNKPFVTEKNKIFQSMTPTNAILKENTSLEYEIISILEMTTNHYDQCSQFYKSLSQEEVENETFNLEVLEKDALELPEVLREMKALSEIISNNEKKAFKIVSAEIDEISSAIASTKSLLKAYNKFKSTNIDRFNVLLDSSLEIFKKCTVPVAEGSTPLDAYIEIVSQLTYHYTKYCEIYKTQYLKEFYHENYEYPKMFLEKLDTIINTQLLQMHDTEENRRMEWLSKYGDFIPKELALPGLSKQPRVVQVVTEGLDEYKIDSSEYKNNEENLVKYIRSMNTLPLT